jgi:hypothetical protein
MWVNLWNCSWKDDVCICLWSLSFDNTFEVWCLQISQVIFIAYFPNEPEIWSLKAGKYPNKYAEFTLFFILKETRKLESLRGTSILGEVRNVWISRVTQQLLCSKSHDLLVVFALAHSKIHKISWFFNEIIQEVSD